jgi:hypothetical protein
MKILALAGICTLISCSQLVVDNKGIEYRNTRLPADASVRGTPPVKMRFDPRGKVGYAGGLYRITLAQLKELPDGAELFDFDGYTITKEQIHSLGRATNGNDGFLDYGFRVKDVSQESVRGVLPVNMRLDSRGKVTHAGGLYRVTAMQLKEIPYDGELFDFDGNMISKERIVSLKNFINGKDGFLDYGFRIKDVNQESVRGAPPVKMRFDPRGKTDYAGGLYRITLTQLEDLPNGAELFSLYGDMISKERIYSSGRATNASDGFLEYGFRIKDVSEKNVRGAPPVNMRFDPRGKIGYAGGLYRITSTQLAQLPDDAELFDFDGYMISKEQIYSLGRATNGNDGFLDYGFRLKDVSQENVRGAPPAKMHFDPRGKIGYAGGLYRITSTQLKELPDGAELFDFDGYMISKEQIYSSGRATNGNDGFLDYGFRVKDVSQENVRKVPATEIPRINATTIKAIGALNRQNDCFAIIQKIISQ